MQEWIKILIYVGTAIAAYIIGGISPSIILSHHIAKKDIREYGSGNAGATNMVRTFGWVPGLLTFALDILKGALVVLAAGYLGKTIGDEYHICQMLAALFAVIGHTLPIYYRFKGGKGVSTMLGVLLVVLPWPALIGFGVALILILSTCMVSLGSLSGMVALCVAAFAFPDYYLGFRILAVVLSCYSFFLHRENIKRLFQGKENKLRIWK